MTENARKFLVGILDAILLEGYEPGKDMYRGYYRSIRESDKSRLDLLGKLYKASRKYFLESGYKEWSIYKEDIESITFNKYYQRLYIQYRVRGYENNDWIFNFDCNTVRGVLKNVEVSESDLYTIHTCFAQEILCGLDLSISDLRRQTGLSLKECDLTRTGVIKYIPTGHILNKYIPEKEQSPVHIGGGKLRTIIGGIEFILESGYIEDFEIQFRLSEDNRLVLIHANSSQYGETAIFLVFEDKILAQTGSIKLSVSKNVSRRKYLLDAEHCKGRLIIDRRY